MVEDFQALHNKSGLTILNFPAFSKVLFWKLEFWLDFASNPVNRNISP